MWQIKMKTHDTCLLPNCAFFGQQTSTTPLILPEKMFGSALSCDSSIWTIAMACQICIFGQNVFLVPSSCSINVTSEVTLALALCWTPLFSNSCFTQGMNIFFFHAPQLMTPAASIGKSMPETFLILLGARDFPIFDMIFSSLASMQTEDDFA